jgi:hypothetical protein
LVREGQSQWALLFKVTAFSRKVKRRKMEKEAIEIMKGQGIYEPLRKVFSKAELIRLFFEDLGTLVEMTLQAKNENRI